MPSRLQLVRGALIASACVQFAYGCGARSGMLGLDDVAGGGGGAAFDAGTAAGSGGGSSGGSSTGGGSSGGSSTGGGSSTDGGSVDADAGVDHLEAVLEACAIATSCAEPGPPSGVWYAFTPSVCVDAFGELGRPQMPYVSDPDVANLLVDCAHTSDCAAFRKCYGGGWVSLSRCREGGYCPGQTTLMTGGGGQATFDCAALGTSCVDLWSNALRACCEEPCAGGTDVACKGDVASYCGGWGERVELDCGLDGRTCQNDMSEPCVGKGAPCSAGQKVSCAGSVARYCSGGRLSTYDCKHSWSRTACADGAYSYAPCRAAGTDCDPSTYVGECQGDQLMVCVDGRLRGVSCNALGFDACDLPQVGYARCVHVP